MHADGPWAHGLRGTELWGVERLQLQQCLRGDRDAVAHGDDLQLQLRHRAVRGVHLHRDTVVREGHGRQHLRHHHLRKLGKLQWLQRHLRRVRHAVALRHRVHLHQRDVRLLHQHAVASVLARHGRNVLRHELRRLERLRRLQRLLRRVGDAVQVGDRLRVRRRNVQPFEQ